MKAKTTHALAALTVATAAAGAAHAAPLEIDFANGCVAAGAGIIAENGSARLSFQGDGNLVLYAKDGSGAKWSTGTHRRRISAGFLGSYYDQGRTLCMSNGNLVVVGARGILWQSRTGGQGVDHLEMRGCGFELRAADDTTHYSVARSCEQLERDHAGQLLMDGRCLQPGAGVIAETDDLRLTWQGDGNLVIYAKDGSGAKWASRTHHRGRELCLQEDGEIVVHGDAGVLWTSGTAGDGASALDLTPMGFLPAGTRVTYETEFQEAELEVDSDDPVDEETLSVGHEDQLQRDYIVPESVTQAKEENFGNSLDESIEESDSFGNNNFGGGYAFGMHAAATKLDNQLYATSGIYGETYGILFGKRLTILGASIDLETDGRVHSDDARVTVIGIDQSVDLGGDFELVPAIEKTFVEKSKTFMAGPVPITVAGDLTGSLGVNGNLQPGALGMTLTLTPYATLTASASAGIGGACVSAGIRGSLDIIDVQVPVATTLTVDPFTLEADIDLEGEVNISSLGGSIALYADYCVGSAELELVSWDGVELASIDLINENWTINEAGEAIPSNLQGIQLRSNRSNKCIDVDAGGTANGTNIQQWTCSGDNPNQRFEFVPLMAVSPNTFQIRHVGSGKCLDVNAGRAANGTNIQLWSCSADNRNQQFMLSPTVAGGVAGFSFRNMRTGKCMDLSGGSGANGANIHQWECGISNVNQSFLPISM